MKKEFLSHSLQKKLILALVVLFQILVVVSMFARARAIKNEAEKNGRIIRISCTAYDPFDPFKGRYVRLTLSQDDLKSEGERLGLDLQKLSKNCSDYYMQEDFADFIDKIGSVNFDELKPLLEVYVDKKGRAIQKALFVHENEEEIPIEKFIESKLNPSE